MRLWRLDSSSTSARRAALPIIAAHSLRERRKPFDNPDWLFELKYDGYRALLFVERGKRRLISRNGRHMKRFDGLASALVKARNAILDGEIVVKDASGRPIFLDLMRRRGDASYVAFDLLWLNGEDLRRQPLIERKLVLAGVLPQSPSFIEEAIWIPERGIDLFRLVVEHDLEGIVAKRKDGHYSASSPWLKIKNPGYSQAEGRGELFNPPRKR